jgi:hypothetical protein
MKYPKARTTKKLLLSAAALAGFAALPLYAAPAAQATPSQDASYVSCVARDQISSNLGPSDMAAAGRSMANDIATGVRSAAGEQAYVYNHTGSSITQADANVLVNCATEVWLGYGPPA